MKIIVKLSDFIMDASKTAIEYSSKAIKYKMENKEIAEIFYNMANSIITNLESMHVQIVKLIDKEKKERKDEIQKIMCEIFDMEHERIIKAVSQAKANLQIYQKM